MTVIVPAAVGHSKLIQCEPVNGVDVEGAIARAIELSSVCFTGKVGGEIIAIWGVQSGSLLSRSGYLWLTTTENIVPYQFIFAKESKRFITRVSEDFDMLYGIVDDREAIAKRFVRWLGFGISAPVLVNSVPLCRFWRRWR